ncbi:FimV family protein, partial [Pseudomonas aeruginosa]|uniref:FimV family protein n=1 Tax=Pseudomonas aeruginosa TaxID=287 RepID=UPI0034CFA73D
SSKPVQEPYLNFLVQVLWPNGRLLREYTVLLDPPLYSPQAAAPPAAPGRPAPVAATPARRDEALRGRRDRPGLLPGTPRPRR